MRSGGTPTSDSSSHSQNIDYSTPPEPFKFEVSVIGPGFGESIVVHVGDGHWIVIDSGISQKTGAPFALEYLESLGVDVQTDVCLVVASHWDSDHVRGLGELFRACQSAEFVCSIALSSEDFATLVQAYSDQAMMTTTAMSEFVEVTRELQSRRQRLGARYVPPKFAQADLELWNRRIESMGGVDCKISSLSPSSATFLMTQFRLASLGLVAGRAKLDIPEQQPNDIGVVLWIEIGDVGLLFGGDRERTSDPLRGWSGVRACQSVRGRKACFFKVPHHGSEDAEAPENWVELLVESPIAVLTPFNRLKNPLPTSSDVGRIMSRTENAYSSARLVAKRLRRRDHVLRQQIQSTVRNIVLAEPSQGHVRIRGETDKPFATWEIELFGDACHLAEVRNNH